MSAPETNVEKEKRRSKPALAAIAAAVVIVLGIAFFIATSDTEETEPGAIPDPLDAVTGSSTDDS